MPLRARFVAPAALLAVALACQSASVAQDKEDASKLKKIAAENMKKVKVDKPTIEETDNFIIVGTFSPEKAQALGKVLEKTLSVARKAAKYDDKETAWKGKLTVYYLPEKSGDAFKTFMRSVLVKQPEGIYVDYKSDPPVVVDPADTPGKPTEADLFAYTAARVAGELLRAKGTGTQNVPEWLRDGFGRVTQMRAEGVNSKRYLAYKTAARNAAAKNGIAEAWGEARAASVEAAGASVAEFLAFGPKAADFGKFLDALRPSDGNQNPTIQTGFEALGWKEQAQAEAAWKRWVQTGK